MEKSKDIIYVKEKIIQLNKKIFQLRLFHQGRHVCYFYAKDPSEAKYQLLINKKESTGLKYLNGSKAFIEFSNNMDEIYKNIQECIQIKNKKYQ